MGSPNEERLVNSVLFSSTWSAIKITSISGPLLPGPPLTFWGQEYVWKPLLLLSLQFRFFLAPQGALHTRVWAATHPSKLYPHLTHQSSEQLLWAAVRPTGVCPDSMAALSNTVPGKGLLMQALGPLGALWAGEPCVLGMQIIVQKWEVSQGAAHPGDPTQRGTTCKEPKKAPLLRGFQCKGSVAGSEWYCLCSLILTTSQLLRCKTKVK